MAEDPMIRIVDDCITRLQTGQTIAECLRAYPQYRNELAPLLEAGMLYRRVQVTDVEVAQSQQRVQARFEQALTSSPQPMARVPRFFWLTAATLVMLALMAGTTLAAQSSIPGDVLYPVKRISEEIVLILPGDTAQRETAFNQRRIREIRQLLALQREASISFTGDILFVEERRLLVADLPVERTLNTRIETDLAPGTRIIIDGRTTHDGRYVAKRIRPVETAAVPVLPTHMPSIKIPSVVPPTATAPPTRTPRPTLPPTYTRIPEIRPTQMTAVQRPPATFTATDAQRPEIRPTDTVNPGLRPTESPVSRATLMPTEGCVPSQPAGWISYTIQVGDTLSALATRANTTVAAVQRVNCIADPRLIVTGSRILLPLPPTAPARISDTPVPARTTIPTRAPLIPTRIPTQRNEGDNAGQEQRDPPVATRQPGGNVVPTSTPSRGR